ncbi:GGDEF domain-containing protein [Anaerotalea alkaliphila]|uniref:Diguanylate cyclase n=1 Tax=Anaerotalea alkaliphila TaxID=2662126 RepID=A0A7X5KPR2_9FIRM|nr:diguanylate cyclase [Anaerotalea alkaliphila]NDL68792.1 diguanylate cyclase [Anaerotalea alkaliphila]
MRNATYSLFFRQAPFALSVQEVGTEGIRMTEANPAFGALFDVDTEGIHGKGFQEATGSREAEDGTWTRFFGEILEKQAEDSLVSYFPPLGKEVRVTAFPLDGDRVGTIYRVLEHPAGSGEGMEEWLKARAQVDVDPVTGAYNSYFMLCRVKEEMELADRYDLPFTLTLLEIDHFVQILDIWGKKVGFEILAATARLLRERLRTTDVVGRFGVGRFLILTPVTGLDGAEVMGEKLRSAVETGHHPVVGRFTCSMGMAERLKAESLESVQRRAEAALLAAKTEGRNRVQTYSLQQAGDLGLEFGEGTVEDAHRELLDLARQVLEAAVDDGEVLTASADKLLAAMRTHAEGQPEGLAKIWDNLLKKAEKFREAYGEGGIGGYALASHLMDGLVREHMRMEKEWEKELK